MCDTLAWVGPDGTWFAKNSDRPPHEVQVIRSFASRPSAGTVRTQYLDIADGPASAIVAASQPTWLWGFETAINEHRVAIGNETVYTTADRWGQPPALIGMDLVRLAVERSTSAAEARSVITDLLEQHGQGGSAWEHTNEPYFSSFLIADPTEAWIVETSARAWATRHVVSGGVAISNRLSITDDWTLASAEVSIGTDWQTHRDPKAPTGIADHRLARTDAAVSTRPTLDTFIAALRDHGSAHPMLPHDVGDDWSGVTVCMHVRGYQATTASIITWLPNDTDAPIETWAALGSPCVSIYLPVRPDTIATLGDENLWRRFAALRNRVEADPTGLRERATIRAALDPIEAALRANAIDVGEIDTALRDLGV